MADTATRESLALTVKKAVIRESNLTVDPADIPDDEPLTGELLRLDSRTFVGLLVQLEDELDISFADDLFESRQFHTVDDVVRALAQGLAGG